MRFPQIRSTFGVTPYNPERDPERARAIYEHYQDQVGTQPLPDESLPWNVPFEPGVAAQREFDDMLQQRIVDPLAQAGYEDLGAGLAAVPSAAHSMIVPQTEMDLAGTIIPLPGVAKAMKKGKFRKIRNAMKAESPDDVAEIIAKQAGKEVPLSSGIEGPKAEVRAYDEQEKFRQIDEANAKEKEIQNYLRNNEAKVDSHMNDFSKIKDNEMYEIDGEMLSGSDLRDYLLSLSTGDFHTAKWKLKPKADVVQMKTDAANPRKGDPKLTNGQLEQLEAEIDKLDDEIDQLKPSDPDYNIMLDKRIFRLQEIEKIIENSLKAKQRDRLKVVEPTKPPKGDPEASLSPPPDRFAGIKSQLDVIPSRVDERGQAFGDVGSYDFRPNDEMMMQFEPIQKRNYVESELDPKEKMWNEIVASDPYLPDSPEYLQNLRKYFDNRWQQAQGTAEGKMMQIDMPMSQRLKPKDEKSVTSGYIDELAFKRFAEPYDKTIQAERALAKKPGDKPVRTAKIDDKIQSYFGYEIKSPGRKLQDQMYPPKPKEPERFGQIKEQITEKSLKAEPKRPRLRVIKVGDGKDVTASFGVQENMAGMSADELQKIVDATGKRYKVIEDKYIPSGQKNTQGKYHVTDWAGNEIRELGTYDSTEDAYDEIVEWLRSKGVDEADLDLEVGEFDVRSRKK